MGKIKIVLARAHGKQAENPDIQWELADIQQFFDKKEFVLKEGTIHFVLIRGIYTHLERTLNVVGVFVNKTDHAICGMEADLTFQVKAQPEAKLAGVALELPQSFLGEVQPDEGFILHIKVPVQGLPTEKQVYEATELAGALANVKMAYLTE